MIEWPDVVQGIFQLSAGGFVSLSVWQLHRDKIVRGVSYKHVAFFSVFGFWNLFFFSNYDLWFSFWGSLGVVSMNTIWLCQILYYRIKEYQECGPRV